MMHELMHRTADGPRDPIQLLIFASLIRDDAPWIYEIALEAYRALRSGRRGEGQKAVRRFLEVLDMLQSGPFLEELGIDRTTLKFVRSDFFRFFEFSAAEEEVDANSAAEMLKKVRAEKT